MSTERELEQVSALIDGALDDGAERALLARLEEQPALRARWGRYHLIGDALRGEPVAGAAFGIAARVRDRLANEPVIVTPARTRLRHRPSWLQPAIGFAAAASFGAAVVVLFPRDQAPAPPPSIAAVAPSLPAQPAERPGGWAVVEQVPITRWQRPRQDVDRDLHRFLTDHTEFAATGVKGAMPLATLVGYGPRR
jgi:sigma-E factor negative regulatory protein RseA